MGGPLSSVPPDAERRFPGWYAATSRSARIAVLDSPVRISACYGEMAPLSTPVAGVHCARVRPTVMRV